MDAVSLGGGGFWQEAATAADYYEEINDYRSEELKSVGFAILKDAPAEGGDLAQCMTCNKQFRRYRGAFDHHVNERCARAERQEYELACGLSGLQCGWRGKQFSWPRRSAMLHRGCAGAQGRHRPGRRSWIQNRDRGWDDDWAAWVGDAYEDAIAKFGWGVLGHEDTSEEMAQRTLWGIVVPQAAEYFPEVSREEKLPNSSEKLLGARGVDFGIKRTLGNLSKGGLSEVRRRQRYSTASHIPGVPKRQLAEALPAQAQNLTKSWDVGLGKLEQLAAEYRDTLFPMDAGETPEKAGGLEFKQVKIRGKEAEKILTSLGGGPIENMRFSPDLTQCVGRGGELRKVSTRIAKPPTVPQKPRDPGQPYSETVADSRGKRFMRLWASLGSPDNEFLSAGAHHVHCNGPTMSLAQHLSKFYTADLKLKDQADRIAASSRV